MHQRLVFCILFINQFLLFRDPVLYLCTQLLRVFEWAHIFAQTFLKMHSIFDCLGMKERVRKPPPLASHASLLRRQTVDKWAETIRLFSFDEIPADDARFASLTQFRESCEALFELPEIRRVCFESR